MNPSSQSGTDPSIPYFLLGSPLQHVAKNGHEAVGRSVYAVVVDGAPYEEVGLWEVK